MEILKIKLIRNGEVTFDFEGELRRGLDNLLDPPVFIRKLEETQGVKSYHSSETLKLSEIMGDVRDMFYGSYACQVTRPESYSVNIEVVDEEVKE